MDSKTTKLLGTAIVGLTLAVASNFIEKLEKSSETREMVKDFISFFNPINLLD